MLARVELIAEPWDIGPGGYQLGDFPPGWLEWNDRFRDTHARLLAAARGARRGDFARRCAAPATMFQQRRPRAVRQRQLHHRARRLHAADLVSYDERHNEANGEGNRDGHGDNLSTNCGVEGDTDDAAMLAAARPRCSARCWPPLLLSQGTPMLLAGDELGHSQGGNNNAYCQDNEITGSTGERRRGADRLRRAAAALRREAALRSTRW